MRAARVAILLGLCLITLAVAAQGVRTQARLTPFVDSDGVRVGTSTRLALRVVLPAGFHAQSNVPRDPALIPTILTITAPPGVKIEQLLYPTPTDFKLAGQAQPLSVFGAEFVIGFLASVATNARPGTIEIRGQLHYQACDENVCYAPTTAEVLWSVRVVPANAAVAPRNAEIFSQVAPATVPALAVTPELVTSVRAAIATNELARAEKILADYRTTNGITPEYLLAHSWLGRAALAARQLDQAEAFARETYNLGITELRTRPMDLEPLFPTAFSASIEVLGNVAAQRGRRTEAVSFLNEQLRLFGDTSVHKRIQKNINTISLEGSPAPALDLSESQGVAVPAIASLKGRVVLLYFWAHWCPDCKAQGPILEQLLTRYGSRGLSILAPTQRYGYVAGGTLAGSEEEARYISQVRQTSYPWLAQIPVPLSANNHLRYGVSTTPTLVLVGRDGLVKLYHPGKMTEAELDPLIQGLMQSPP